MSAAYEPLGGERHRHGALVHEHPHGGPHEHAPAAVAHAHAHPHEHAPTAGAHAHAHPHDHGHSHGLLHPSIRRSREGMRAVGIALLVLGLAAAAQAAVFVASGSIALLADLIHNAGDAATAVPVGAAFMLRSARAERWAGLAVVAAIFASACVAGFEAVDRLVHPQHVHAFAALAAAGALGFAGNWVAGAIRSRAGRRLGSPALVADGAHARADAYVSLAVIASAAAVALGAPVADPLIGLAMTFVILRICLHSWRVVRAGAHEHHHH